MGKMVQELAHTQEDGFQGASYNVSRKMTSMVCMYLKGGSSGLG